jgi:hypothetical protein
MQLKDLQPIVYKRFFASPKERCAVLALSLMAARRTAACSEDRAEGPVEQMVNGYGH